jgi:hypothetical protein
MLIDCPRYSETDCYFCSEEGMSRRVSTAARFWKVLIILLRQYVCGCPISRPSYESVSSVAYAESQQPLLRSVSCLVNPECNVEPCCLYRTRSARPRRKL